MELCNRGYNSNLKNLLVKHQNNSVYCHRWRLLSGVSLICFYGIIWEIFLAELHGWLTVDERAFARLYPWNHEVSIFWVGAEKARLFIGRNCTCRGCFIKSRSVFSWGRQIVSSPRSARRPSRARSRLRFCVLRWAGSSLSNKSNRVYRTITDQSMSVFIYFSLSAVFLLYISYTHPQGATGSLFSI